MVTRSNRVGLEGYQEALDQSGSGLTFADLLADFHTANLVNDRAVDPRFGYENEQRTLELKGLRVPAPSRFDGQNGISLQADSVVVKSSRG